MMVLDGTCGIASQNKPVKLKKRGKNIERTTPKSGSDPKSGPTGGNIPPPPPSTGNETAKVSIDQALAELESKKTELKAAADTITDLTQQLKVANDVLEGQAKAKLIGEIMPRSNFKLDELTGKTIDELQNIRETLEVAKAPTYKNVHLGVLAADVSDREKGLTVGDLSIVTAEKRKRSQESR